MAAQTTQKYYTPTIEEFHVGFEYEQRELDDTWSRQIADVHLYHVNRCVEAGYIRIRYLDESDILAEGWEFIPDDSVGDGNFRWYSHYSLGKWSLMDILEPNRYVIRYAENERGWFSEDNNRFVGTIRNHSELKLIMKMLGIPSKNPTSNAKV